jgi:FkbM family methyltransferase
LVDIEPDHQHGMTSRQPLNLTDSRRRQAALVLTAVIAVAGWSWFGHDTLLLAALVWAGGLLWCSRKWRAGLLATAITAAGLWWSSLDLRRCSAWWRGRVVYEKVIGHLPYLGWKGIKRQILSPCYEIRKSDPGVERAVFVEDKIVDGQKLELLETELGDFWVPAPGRGLLSWLVWEIAVQVEYESDPVAIRIGDTVIDCGAHVGVFTKYALRRGAGHVIAIEPDRTNLGCLQANLAQEIQDGRVNVIKAGIWDRRTYLRLQQWERDSARHTFGASPPDATEADGTLVLPLDDLVEALNLQRVDFIKMDIEGAERRALRGAQQTLKRFRPRMAICTYHQADDPVVIPQIAKEADATYKIHAKDVDVWGARGKPKVLFFH